MNYSDEHFQMSSLKVNSSSSNIEKLEKWVVIFLDRLYRLTAELEMRVTGISMPLQLLLGKIAHPKYCQRLRGAPILKNLPVIYEHNICKTV